MYTFDESALIKELRGLTSEVRLAFAAAAATRMSSCYELLARHAGSSPDDRILRIIGQLWEDIRVSDVDWAAWSARLDEVMGLLPEEGDKWTIVHALADDAVASLAYAIRCLLYADPQEAAWAARRAYEAADQAAIRMLLIQPGTPGAEVAIAGHEFVQRELRRQHEDLAMLRTNSFDEVQRRAQESPAFTNEEVAAVVRGA